MRILVTGGTGFVGSNIVRELHERGHEVLITGNDAEQKILQLVTKYLQPSFLGIDWDAIGKVDILFHEAAINDTLLSDRDEMMRANLLSSQELFKRVYDNGCRRIVYASSTAVYGNADVPFKENGRIQPLNVYGESKKLLDEFAMEFAHSHPGVTVVGLRYCNVYGPGEQHKGKRASMIYQLAKQMQMGDPKLFKSGEQKRDWIYVKDVVSANLLASEAKESCVVNCGSGSATSFNDLVRILNKTLGLERKPIYMDNPYEKTYQNHTYCDMALAKQKISFVPHFDIENGIQDYAASGSLLT